MILAAIPTIQSLPPVPMAKQSLQKMRVWAQTFVAAVRQRSDRQETTMTRWQELELPRRTSNREREIQLVEPVIFERSDFEEQQENSGKQDEEEDGILEYDSPSDDDDIPSLEQVADSSPRKRFPLWKKCLLQKQNCVQLVFLYLLVMEL